MAVLQGREALDAAIRSLVAEDARWVSDLMLSTQAARSDIAELAPLLLLGYSSRIVVEGSRTARSKSVAAAVQPLVDLLPKQDDPVIVKARHATKLTDGVEAGSTELARHLVELRDAHRKSLFGLAPRLLWKRLADLALLQLGDHRVGISVPLQFQYGAPATVTLDQLGPMLGKVARQHGQILGVLSALGLDSSTPSSTLDSTALATLRSVSGRSSVIERDYLELPVGEALELAAIEGQINTALYLLTVGEAAYAGPVFRARFLTLVHALRSIDQIAQATTTEHPRAASKLRELVRGAFARELLEGRAAALLRDRLMHYSIRSNKVVLETEAPLLGLVEASWPPWTAAELEDGSLLSLRSLSKEITGWRH